MLQLIIMQLFILYIGFKNVVSFAVQSTFSLSQ